MRPSAAPRRVRRAARGWLAQAVSVAALAGFAATLAGCGAPPEPLPTAPPRAASAVAPSGGSGAPTPGATPPLDAGLPLPTLTPPTIPVPTTTPAPQPAPRCRTGPSARQVLAAVRGKPGIPPNARLAIGDGPYCAGDWQYATIKLAADPNAEPLPVVTRGKPNALTVVEAGGDVCSDRVQRDAPVGIRLRACGS
jgi:hypothetical protein